MTLLVASIPVGTLAEVRNLSGNAFAGGADAVELRLDSYHEDWQLLANYLRQNADRDWIITSRETIRYEGQHRGGAGAGSILHHLYFALVASTHARVDFDVDEFFALSATQRQTWETRPEGTLILSHHDFNGLPASLSKTVGQIAQANGKPLAKVAYLASSVEDSFAALDLMNKHRSRAIAIAMGEDGLWTRILAKKLGAAAAYCSLSAEATTAPGQLTLTEMVDLFRWQQFGFDTRVFGVIGDPVVHSMSPRLFNHWFAEAGVDAVYLPIRVRSKNSIPDFLNQCLSRPWLGIGGFSVTVPHKVAALEWLGGGADRLAGGVGAVNNLTFRDGNVGGFNTDCYAALASLTHSMGCESSALRGLSIDVLGAGGAARAVVSGLIDVGADVTVYPRTHAHACWAMKLGCRVATWDDRLNRRGTILINTTPIGMWPGVDISPLPAKALAGCSIVFDLIYNPPATRLLRDAAIAGATALNGLDMFIRQAAMQFSLWVGREPDRESGTRVVADALKAPANTT